MVTWSKLTHVFAILAAMFVAVIGIAVVSVLSIDRAPVSPAPQKVVSSPEAQVEGAHSVHVVANPVIHITYPSRSIFAPQEG